MSPFEPAGVLNDRERPRVLLWVRSDPRAAEFAWLEKKAGTFRRVRSLSQVDLTEWDVLVTDEPYYEILQNQYALIPSSWSRVPDHLYIFRVFYDSAVPRGAQYFEVNVDSDGDADVDRALVLGRHVAGHKMLRIGDLPEPIQDLVKSELLPAAEARDKQFGILRTSEDLTPAVVKLRPFLLGPGGLMIAASLERPAGKSVWLVPSDAGNREAWFDAAMREWHVSDARTFPHVVTWQTDEVWDTIEERSSREQLKAVEAEFATAREKYDTAKALATKAFEDANAKATTGPKALLTGQDEPLQSAVDEALQHLGFDVQDMDRVWPDRERREDFRISDPSEPGWLVLADATGVAKGAPGSKIATVMGYVTKYVLEESPASLPGIWVVVNRLFSRDPMTRGDIYRPDDLTVLESANGLALDTAALFLLTQAIDPGSARANGCRAWLRSTRGQLTVEDAVSWLAANP